MKKTISIILAALMLLSVFGVTAMAANGPNTEKDELGYYSARIILLNVEKDGGDVSIYNENVVDNDAIEGASYDIDTNTLTLTDFNHPEFCLSLCDMGDDFKLNVVGDCTLFQITSSTDKYGGSLNITGTGLLIVNPDRKGETAVRILADGADSTLHIDNTVSVKLLSCENAVEFQGTAHADKDTVFMQGQDTVVVEGGKNILDEPVMIDGAYISRDTTVEGYRAHMINDPNYEQGLFSVTITQGDGGGNIYHVVKYVISDQFGVWVKDDSFDPVDLDEGEFNSNFVISTQQGSTPKEIEYLDENNEPATGYLVIEKTPTNGETKFVIDIDFDHNPDEMMHRAKPLDTNDSGEYILVLTWGGYEVDVTNFYNRGLSYVYEDEYANFDAPVIATGEFEVFEDAEGGRYVFYDEGTGVENVYKISEDNKVTIEGKEYYVLTMWQGVVKDNLTPVTELVGDNNNYKYPDPDYIYTAPDEPETTDPIFQPTTDPSQQGTTDPNQQSTTDPNGQPATDPNQQSTTDPNGQQGTTDPNQQPTTDPSGQPSTDPNQQGTTAVVEPTTVAPQPATKAAEPEINEVKKGDSEKQVDKYVTKLKTEKDVKGSVFGLLCARQKDAKNKSVTVRWNKLPKAKAYLVYGSKCGTKKGVIPPYKKIKKTKKLSYKRNGLKKGTYFKFLIFALDKNNKVLATSKTVHIATKGGKVGNDKTVKVNKTKKTLKVKKSFKIKAKEVPQSKKLKVKRHRGIKFESNNKKVAKVSSTGKVTAKKKGKATIYVYAQNGFYKKVKITVK